MERRKSTLPNGQVQLPRKGLHSHSNKVMSPRPPYQTESVKEEDPHSKLTLMPCVNHNVKSKFFPHPEQMTTATSSSNLKPQTRDTLSPPAEHREMTVSLPQLDHSATAKPSFPKTLHKTILSPLKHAHYKDSTTSMSLTNLKYRRTFFHDSDTSAEPSRAEKLPKVPLTPNNLCNSQQHSNHQTEASLNRGQRLKNPSHPDGQNNTRINLDYKKRAIPVSSSYSKFETKTAALQLPCHSHPTKASKSLTVYQKTKSPPSQCQNHQLKVQPLPRTTCSLKTRVKPLSSPNHWARDTIVPPPCPMYGSTAMVMQCTESNNSERTRAEPTDPDHVSIPSQYNQPSYILSSEPSSLPELSLQDADYEVEETSTSLSNSEQDAVFYIDPEHQVETRHDYNPKMIVSSSDSVKSVLFPLCSNQWTKIASDPDQLTSTLQDPDLKSENAVNQEECVEITPHLNQDYRINSSSALRYQEETFMEANQQAYPLPPIKERVKAKLKLDQQVELQKSCYEQAKYESRRKHWGEIPLAPEQQDQTLSAQGHQLEVTSDPYQGTTTLISHGYKTEAQLGHDHLSGVKITPKTISPLGRHHLGKDPVDLKTQATSLSDSGLDYKSSYAELKATATIGHPHSEKTLVNSRFPVIPDQGRKYSFNEDAVESLPNTYYHTNAIQKLKSPWCFRYIKPYTVEGGSIPDRIVNKIVLSIPHEKIKNDMQKILLQQIKRFSTSQNGQSLSSNYNVCLLCASWIPHGCFHINEMKYHCRAQLVATPVPLPSSKVKIGIKFALKIPKQPSSTFCLTLPHYDVPGPSKPLRPFPSPSYLTTTPFESPIDHWKASVAPWPDYKYGKDHYLTGRQAPRSQPTFLGKVFELRNAIREEKARCSGGVFKSLLEKFQRKRRAY
ncbi:uncharacterized protein LOC127557894 isoform X2 [Antechinus flavipes]|uniref:uncharacterized protein LOC127557894 isoform X2 n=1 Tax=Antechinus flavipes TaxID=38775 RepID=UPI0022364B26|nr:uncharacterized protein LOC127557894 isoform X2 [Antechinus flavipes]